MTTVSNSIAYALMQAIVYCKQNKTRKLCYRKDDRAMRAIQMDRMSLFGDMAIRNYP